MFSEDYVQKSRKCKKVRNCVSKYISDKIVYKLVSLCDKIKMKNNYKPVEGSKWQIR